MGTLGTGLQTIDLLQHGTFWKMGQGWGATPGDWRRVAPRPPPCHGPQRLPAWPAVQPSCQAGVQLAGRFIAESFSGLFSPSAPGKPMPSLLGRRVSSGGKMRPGSWKRAARLRPR